ncbi:MAG: serine hydrolase [Gemmatimonadota bacterium]
MRKKPFLLMTATGLGVLLSSAGASAQPAQLKPRLEQRIASHQGTVGLAIIDLTTGERWSIRGDQPVSSASVIKLPILVELFHQIRRGPIKLSDPVIMTAADQRPGSGVLQFLSTPHQLTIGDAATLMITLSDNTATNLIIDKVGIRNVNARMDSLGLHNTRLHAKVFLGSATTIDTAATRKWGFGVTTPSEMAELLAKLHRGELVSDSASQAMIAMLRNNFDYAEIPRLLPAGVSVAHKTGALNAARHDCGIVYAKSGAYVLCAFTSENSDQSWRLDNEARVTIAELARITHEFMTAGK